MKDGVFYDSEVGILQGSVISPLLANIYLNYLDTMWEKHYSSIGILVRYCDDFVIMCGNLKDAQHAYKVVEQVMRKLDLTLNKEKARIVNLEDISISKHGIHDMILDT